MKFSTLTFGSFRGDLRCGLELPVFTRSSNDAYHDPRTAGGVRHDRPGPAQKMRPVPLSTISARQGISLSYLEQLFSALRRAGLVDSTRGPGGGYTLARQAEQVSVAEIILAVENLKTDELQNLGPSQAAQVKSMTGELWTSFNSRVMEYLQSVTLQDLVTQALEQGTVVELSLIHI